MFKVLCINDDATYGKHIILRKGAVYNAVGENKNADGADCYELDLPKKTYTAYGRLKNSGALYLKSRFIILQQEQFKKTTYTKVLEEIIVCDN
jgi:hypothetical protein